MLGHLLWELLRQLCLWGLLLLLWRWCRGRLRKSLCGTVWRLLCLWRSSKLLWRMLWRMHKLPVRECM